MSTLVIFAGVSAFVGFILYSVGKMIVWIGENSEDFEDIRIPETFELPKKLHEIEEKEKAASRCND